MVSGEYMVPKNVTNQTGFQFGPGHNYKFYLRNNRDGKVNKKKILKPLISKTIKCYCKFKFKLKT